MSMLIDAQQQITVPKDVVVISGHLMLVDNWGKRSETLIYSGAAHAIIRKRVKYQRGERYLMFLCLDRRR